MVHKSITVSLKTAGHGILRTPLGEFTVIKSLGEGSYGKVKLVMNIATHEKYAVKIIRRQVRRGNWVDAKRTASLEKRVIREANMARLLSHPNIVSLSNFRITDTHFYLFYEYIDGCQLADKIGRKGICEEKAKKYLHQIIAALSYCHGNSITHRDIKIENILVDKSDTIKLIDFGLANFFNRNEVLRTSCGSIPYTAPEILRGEPYVGPEVDIWSIGVVLFVMVAGYLPFGDPARPKNFDRIMAARVKYPASISEECRNLISRCLDPVRMRRLTISQIYAHSFLAGLGDITSPYTNPNTTIALPKILSDEIVREMATCLFDTEDNIRSLLLTELTFGRQNHGEVLVKPSPVSSVYNLISKNQLKNSGDTFSRTSSTEAIKGFNIPKVGLTIYLNHCVLTISKANASNVLNEILMFLDDHQLAYFVDHESAKVICQHSPSVGEHHWSILERRSFSVMIRVVQIKYTNSAAVIIKRANGDKNKFQEFKRFLKIMVKQIGPRKGGAPNAEA
ncbi:Pkinase-domain-containing protein [Basidiobolus meristosporus CBS 931.73]|uniref:Pkinase-domain-containing protein n=1 Tax=Basidiobolus meristosporus CBS 931.73 TaxID=1314790 RepID=A0A1Y1WPX0_9FUNG|nr:Pkinase-domain-containing protein [Basidiobolus meristosporus CBS 931.73]|eukprot:ORX75587.1 Pkinase-domain-containing protein [Basidiobolus meristosporus CBS 931.73]